MLDAYLELPNWLRTLFAMIVLGAGVMMAYDGYKGGPKFIKSKDYKGEEYVSDIKDTPGASYKFRFGFIVTGMGFVLLMAAGKSSSEKKGYHF